MFTTPKPTGVDPWALATRKQRNLNCGPSLLDAVHVLDAAQNQRSTSEGGGRPELVAERVLAQHLERRTGLEHVRRSGVVEAEDLAVVGPRRGPEGARVGDPFAAVGLFA